MCHALLVAVGEAWDLPLLLLHCFLFLAALLTAILIMGCAAHLLSHRKGCALEQFTCGHDLGKACVQVLIVVLGNVRFTLEISFILNAIQ